MSNIRYTLITGASTGIGYELSKVFAKDKHNLILVSRNKTKLQAVKDELLKYNIDIKILALDLGNDEDIQSLLSEEKIFYKRPRKNMRENTQKFYL